MTGARPYDVFLSYSRKDRDWVAAFTESLHDAGVNGWFDVHSSALPGEPWEDRIEEALRDSKFLVVILSPDFVESPWTFFELGAAVADRKKIIPVLTEDVKIDRLPSVLRKFQALREPSPLEAGKRVAEVIKAAA